MKLFQLIAVVIATSLVIDSAAAKCSIWKKIECGAALAACAVACIDPLDGICEACFSGLGATDCFSCVFSETELNNMIGFKGESGQTCNSSEWLSCNARMVRCEAVCEANKFASHQCVTCLGDEYVDCVYCVPEIGALQSNCSELWDVHLGTCSAWDWLKCAAKVATCAGTCYDHGITSQECMGCFGSLYDQCKKCVGLQNAVVQNAVLLKGCGPTQWVRCAAEVAKCSLQCFEYGFTSAQCTSCLGPAIDCLSCITPEEMQLSAKSTLRSGKAGSRREL